MSAQERIAAAQELLFATVEVTNAAGEVFTGVLYGYEPTSDTYVIRKKSAETAGRSTLKFMANAAIANMKVIAPPAPEVLFRKGDKLQEKSFTEFEQKSVELARKARAKHNSSATTAAQALFNRLDKNFECEWDGTSIVIRALRVRLDAPYNAENITGSDPTSVNRIKTMANAVLSA